MRNYTTILGIALLVQISLSKNSTGEKQVIEIEIIKNAKMNFVKIEPGTFLMGNEQGGKEEQPVHKVTIKNAFYMSVFETTQSQWEAVMGSNPSKFKGADHPVEQVLWTECKDFAKKVSVASKKWNFRLPTEAEWEYACKAGTTSLWSFGNDETILPEYAWYGTNSNQSTHPVGQKKPNPWGLFDIYGNVWEWVEDKDHPNYNGAPEDGSSWENSGGKYHIVRGGSWDDPIHFCQSSSRPQYYPAEKSIRYGFRLVCVPK